MSESREKEIRGWWSGSGPCEHAPTVMCGGCDIRDLLEALDEARAEAMAARKALWLNHGHKGQYADDGEMQCIQCGGSWDYLRPPLDVVAVAAMAALVSMPLAWTSEPPTSPGWYWHRVPASEGPFVVQVLTGVRGDYLVARYSRMSPTWTDFAGEWAGPIPAPTSPAYEAGMVGQGVADHFGHESERTTQRSYARSGARAEAELARGVDAALARALPLLEAGVAADDVSEGSTAEAAAVSISEKPAK